jgi:hypothetical protein
VVIQPEWPQAGEDLTCVIERAAFDGQGDGITYAFQWRENGTDVADLDFAVSG